MLVRLVLSLIFSLISSQAISAQLPKQLTESDRQEVLKILGFGSATKLNSDPTPLGGHSGLEFFISSDVISIESLQKLGDRSGSGNQIMSNSIGVGKGLFFDIDTYLFFSPLQLQNKYSQMGAYIRKVIYTDDNRPWRAALSLHGNGTSYENLVNLTTSGVDLIFSYEWPEITVSAGVGQARTIGTFIGGGIGPNGPYGINDTSDTFSGDLQQHHWLVSISRRWEKTYLSLEYDRYYDATFSLKFGYRL
ncbi:MAG: hypothetical protein AABY64_07445 [Bdellovibrionota bacterium]